MLYIFSLPQISSGLNRTYAISVEILTYDDSGEFIKAEEWVNGELKEFEYNKGRVYAQEANFKELISECKVAKKFRKPLVFCSSGLKHYHTHIKQEALLIQLYYTNHIKQLLEKEKNKIDGVISKLPKEDEGFIKKNFPQYFI